MITLINRFSKYSIVILGFLTITLSHAQDDRADGISILDVDANGKVDALTDGLLILRSMFGLTDETLATGVVDLTNCTECDAEGIDTYITSIKGATYGGLTPESGPTGPQGEKGEKGDKGDAGAQGVAGADGATGAKGDAGTNGTNGVDGATGAKGDKGDKGAQGIQGLTGSAGSAGAQGDKGDNGAIGVTGAIGPQGEKGDKGDIGATGATGAAGIDGLDGSDGATGPAGATGVTGAQGPAGAGGIGLTWVSASNNVNGYWYFRYNTILMAVQISGSDLVYTSPYDPEDGSHLTLASERTYYTSSDCQGTAYVENAPLTRLEHSGSGYLIKRTSQKGGSTFTANSYYGMSMGVHGCYNDPSSVNYGGEYYETELTSLLMSTYQQSHTLRWSN